MDKATIRQYRAFLKDSIRKTIDFSQTDQNRGIMPPPVQKPFSKEKKRIDLAGFDQFKDIDKVDLKAAIQNRESRRLYSSEAISIKELSFLLWATQGIRQQLAPGHALRTVPSAGCRHAFAEPVGVEVVGRRAEVVA